MQVNQKGLMGSKRWSQWTPASPRNPRRQAGLRSTACSAKSTVGPTRVTTHVTVIILIKTVLLSRNMGVRVSPIQRRREVKVRTLHRFFTPKSRKLSASTCRSSKNIAPMNPTAMTTPITVLEGTGRIALGN